VSGSLAEGNVILSLFPAFIRERGAEERRVSFGRDRAACSGSKRITKTRKYEDTKKKKTKEATETSFLALRIFFVFS